MAKPKKSRPRLCSQATRRAKGSAGTTVKLLGRFNLVTQDGEIEEIKVYSDKKATRRGKPYKISARQFKVFKALSENP